MERPNMSRNTTKMIVVMMMMMTMIMIKFKRSEEKIIHSCF